MRPSERVHIAPLGFERDRVVEAAEQLKADRLILLERSYSNWRKDVD